MSDAQVMILAAGLGTRLWPLTEDRAKPAVPFLGEPLIARLVRHLAGCGFNDIVANTHYQPESVQHALHNAPTRLGARVRFSHETEILGTAGGIRQALDRGLLEPDRPVVVVNGKLETDLDPRGALATHAASQAAVTMVLMPNSKRAAFREVLTDGDRVVGFGQGRHPQGPNPLLFTGMHVLGPEALAEIPEGFSDTVKDIYPRFIEAGRIAAHIETDARWWEFSTLERYADLHREAYELGLGPSVVLSPGAHIAPDADVQASVLWEGAQVHSGASVRGCVLGAGVSIEPGETITNSVVVRADTVQEPGRGTVWGQRLRVPIERAP